MMKMETKTMRVDREIEKHEEYVEKVMKMKKKMVKKSLVVLKDWDCVCCDH